MKVLTIIVLLSAGFLTNANLVGRSLADTNQVNSDPSLSQVCLQAYTRGCNYQAFKTSSACYNPAQSRHLKYCQNCLYKKKSNEVASYQMKQIPQDDCLNQTQANKKKGLSSAAPFSLTKTKFKTALERPLRATLPSSFDYKNYMSAVKNQGTCGCCWAFAGTAVYQALLKINGLAYDLSVQAPLQCTSDYSIYTPLEVSNCGGGYLQDVLNFYSKVGGVLNSKYPYLNSYYSAVAGMSRAAGICNETSRIMFGVGATHFYHGITQDQIKNLLYYNGPVAVAVYANTNFDSYTSGIFTGCPADSKDRLNHAVLLYGWDASGNWLIKNQWGTSWGEAGYMKVSNLSDCGLSSYIGSMNFTSTNPSVEVSMDPQCKKSLATKACVAVSNTTKITAGGNYMYVQIAILALIALFL